MATGNRGIVAGVGRRRSCGESESRRHRVQPRMVDGVDVVQETVPLGLERTEWLGSSIRSKASVYGLLLVEGRRQVERGSDSESARGK